MERCQQLLGEERRSLKSLVEESTVIWIGRDDWIRVASEESFDDIDTLQDLNNLRRLERLRIGGAKPHQ
jgi:ABC-type antimicrobial peptide transport system ATPase subunit